MRIRKRIETLEEYITRHSRNFAQKALRQIMGERYELGTHQESDLKNTIAEIMKQAILSYKPGAASVKSYVYKKGEYAYKQHVAKTLRQKRKINAWTISGDSDSDAENSSLFSRMSKCVYDTREIVTVREILFELRARGGDILAVAYSLEPELQLEGIDGQALLTRFTKSSRATRDRKRKRFRKLFTQLYKRS